MTGKAEARNGQALLPPVVAAFCEPEALRGSQSGDVPLRWAKEGYVLFIGTRDETACPVSRLNVQTGSRTTWKTFSPSDLAGVIGVACPRIAADEQPVAISSGIYQYRSTNRAKAALTKIHNISDVLCEL